MRSIDTEAARAAPGVIAVVTGRELAEIHDPWVGVLTHLVGLKSAPQYALPLDTATWQGEAVVAVVAESRALAEDGAGLVDSTGRCFLLSPTPRPHSIPTRP